ncbi:MAG: WYL domain-containing protein [Kiritimatiellae bacterium]|nr:WYL domain-containing protein [Kiritimatiellia bacterium]
MMERSKSQFARLLEIDRQIRGGKYPNCRSFARAWEVSQKTVQRDINYLRDQLGAPIGYDRLHRGFCYTDNTWFLPSISMSEGELLSLLVAARALEQYRGSPVAKELERIFSVIAAILPGGVSIQPELIFHRFSFTSPPSKPVEEKVWTTMVRGLLQQQSVAIAYRTPRSPEPKERVINPFHIANLQGEWYVLGPVAGETKVLQFSLARIESAALVPRAFEIPDRFDAQDILARVFGRSAVSDHIHDVRLLFDKEAADWVTERQWHPRQKIRRRKSGGVELSFRASGLYELQRWVLSWGHHVRVLAPKPLREMVAEEIRLMAAARRR